MRFILAATTAVLALMPVGASALSLRYIGQQTLPTATSYAGTQVGGLSGIDYIGGGTYVAISDDRSQINPARFYTLGLDLTPTAFSGVHFTAVTTLKTPGGTAYPTLAIDPESIRRTATGTYIYTSEGDKNNNINAFVREADANGNYIRDLALPSEFQQTGPAGTTGVRNNLAFESLTIDGGKVYTATENALVQDGPSAAFGVGSPSRILSFDGATGTPGAQFVYNVSPVTAASTPAGAFSTNGLVELLALGGGKFIAVERSFITGLVTPASATGNSIQLYLVDINDATDVSGFASLAGQSYDAVSKTLLFNLDDLGIPLDNIEGVTFGETLANGHRSLVLVSDNNFAPTQFTQLLAFEVGVPEPATWAMLIIGFGMVGAVSRRRRGIASVTA